MSLEPQGGEKDTLGGVPQSRAGDGAGLVGRAGPALGAKTATGGRSHAGHKPGRSVAEACGSKCPCACAPLAPASCWCP